MSRKPVTYRTLHDRIRAGSKPVAKPVTAWRDLDLQSGWSEFQPGTYSPPAAYRDPSGIIRLRGVIAGGITGDINSPFAVLDENLCPEFRVILATVCLGVAAARVDVAPNGNAAVVAAPSTTWVSLDGLSFRGYAVPA